MEEEEELIYGDLSFEENNNVDDELLMNSPTANDDSHNGYQDEQRHQEEDTSIQLGNSESKEDTYVKETEKEQKEKIIEKERQKVLNTESNKQRKLNNPANFDGMDQYGVPHSHEALVITNLAWWTTDKQVKDLLTPFGKVIRLRFVEDKMNGKSTGECIVAFEQHKNASVAYNELGPNTIIDKKKLNFEVKSANVFDRLKYLKRTDPKFVNSHQHQQQYYQNKQQQQHNNNNQHNNQQAPGNQQSHNQPPFQKQKFIQQAQFQGQDQPSMAQQFQDEPAQMILQQQQRQQRFQFAPNDVRATRANGGMGNSGGMASGMGNSGGMSNGMGNGGMSRGGGGGFSNRSGPPTLQTIQDFQQQQAEFLPHVNPNQFKPRLQNGGMFNGNPSFHGMSSMQQSNFVPHVNPAFLIGGMSDDRMRGRDMDPRDFHRPSFNEPERERKYPMIKQEQRQDSRRDVRDDDRDEGRSSERYERERLREEKERDYRGSRDQRKDDDRNQDERRERKDDRSREKERDNRKDKHRDDEDRNYRDKPRDRNDKDRDREKERKRGRSDYDYESSDRKNKNTRKDDM
jgi:hypothetical protein